MLGALLCTLLLSSAFVMAGQQLPHFQLYNMWQLSSGQLNWLFDTEHGVMLREAAAIRIRTRVLRNYYLANWFTTNQLEL